MSPLREIHCAACDVVFLPVPIKIPAPAGAVIEVQPTRCPDCEARHIGERDREARAEAMPVQTFASVAPRPGPREVVACVKCGGQFERETMDFAGSRLGMTVCDGCADQEAEEYRAAAALRNKEDLQARRQLRWVAMVGPRYEGLRVHDLPAAIQPYVDDVLAWRPGGPKGIGLLGAPRTGKSPLIFGLAHRLYRDGVDVFPTSGIEFQRNYLRGMDEGGREPWQRYLDRCEESDVLVIDDADKLNLSPGVEAEYYGMLEARRNWLRPVLCTLNLTGGEMAGLGRERTDRAQAIVERLRDLCAIITI